MRYFISPKTSVSYDQHGVHYPPHRVCALDFEATVRAHGGTDLKWERMYGRSYCPMVLSFTHPAGTWSSKLRPLRDAMPPAVGVVQHWRSWAAQKGHENRVSQTT